MFDVSNRFDSMKHIKLLKYKTFCLTRILPTFRMVNARNLGFLNHFWEWTLADSVLLALAHFGSVVVDLKIYVKISWLHYEMVECWHCWSSLESEVFVFWTFVWTCKQFNHSDNVIFLSLFTSQYRGIFLPHFFRTL